MSIIKILDHISFGKIVLIREELLKQQAAGKKVIRFESGDPNFDLAPHVLEALTSAAAAGKTHYIPNAGIPQLRRALFEKLTHTNHIPVGSAEDVFVTNGAMHALYIVFAALLEDGDEVIVPDPMWTEIVENIKLAGGKPVRVPLRREEAYLYSAEEIAKHITPRTRAIFLNTPHNPTGAVLDREQLTAILELAKKHDLRVISDEAYEHVIFAPATHTSIASLDADYIDRTITIFSCSKSYAMSGLRVGYIACTDRQVQERLQKLLRCTINGVNSTAQWAALAAVTGPQEQIVEMRAEYERRRDLLHEALNAIEGITPFRPKGSFFIWADCDSKLYERLGVRSADEVSQLLAQHGIGSAPGSAFSDRLTDSLRFAFSCATPMVEEGAVLLQEFLQQAQVAA
ncbi:MAG: aminotransferase class I/II-fold pyridoxal phosphate-dependent enzyme [Acidobacteriaceae bacterium]